MEMRWSVNLVENLKRGGLPLKKDWNFSQALMIRALISVYKFTEDEMIYNEVKKYGDFFVNEEGDVNIEKKSLLRQIIGSESLIDMYRLTKDEKYKKASYATADLLRECNKTAEGVFFSEEEKEYVSIDGLYYLSPFYSRHISTFRYLKRFKDLSRQFMVIYNNLRDKNTGLIRSGYDRRKQMEWADKNTGFSDCFCTVYTARFLVSLVDYIYCLDYTQRDTKELIEIYREVVNSVLKYRNENGCFNLITNEQERKGNYFESYSTIMIFYAIIKGFNIKILFDDKYFKDIEIMYNGIIDEFVTISRNGNININKTCEIGSLFEDTSFSYYMGLPIISNDLSTIAMFILAMVEYEKLKQLIKAV